MSFELTITNSNSAHYSDDQTYLAVIARKIQDGPYFRYDLSSKSFKPISADDNTHPIRQYPPGAAENSFANYFFKLSDAPGGKLTFDEPLIGGRVYVALGDWLPIAVHGPDGYAPPASTNPAVPGYRTIFDKIEFTYQPDANGADAKKLYINTTAVDFMAIPMTLTDGSRTVGFNSTRTQLIDAFESNTTDPHVKSLIIRNPAKESEVLRILNPTGTAHDMGLVIPQADADYFAEFFTNYIDKVWSRYESPNTLTLRIGGDAYTGQVDGNMVFNFHAGTSLDGPKALALSKPPSSDVSGCRNSMASGDDAQKNIQKFLAAAMVRTVALDSPGAGDSWCGLADYYAAKPIYQYANILHQHSHDTLCYAFSYDDVCNQSSIIDTSDPKVTLDLSAW